MPTDEPSNEATFSIDVEGDSTGKTYKGVFKTKIRLSHRDFLRQDQIRRDLLGGTGGDVSPRAASIADVVSHLSVKLVDAPSWWLSASNGLDLEDDSVMAAVYGEVIKVQKNAEDELKKKAEKAKEELRGDAGAGSQR